MIKTYIKKAFLAFSILAIISCKTSERDGEKIVFKAAIGGEPSSLDPHLATDNVAINILDNVFEGIVHYDPKTEKFKAGLAKSWDISQDKREYTFHLRDNLKWSDGKEITADEIRESIIRSLDQNLGNSYSIMVAKAILNGKKFQLGQSSSEELGVKVIDEKTIKIILENPKAYFLDLLSHSVFYPVPMHIIKEKGNKWLERENYIVSGPYKVKERKIKDKIVLEKNPYYWNAENIEIDEVVLYSYEDQNTAFNMYINEEIDWTNGINSDKVQELMLRDDFFVFEVNGINMYLFNTKKEVIKNPKVRKALTLAIDRKLLVDEVIKDGSKASRTISPTFPNYSYERELPLFDLEEARKALRDAGYPDGKGFPKLVLKYNTLDSHKKISEFLQNQWKENLNIEVSLHNEEWTSFLSSRRQFDYDIARAGILGDYNDPITFFEIFTESFNISNYNNAKYDEIIATTERETNNLKRELLFREAEKMLVEIDFPAIPLFIATSKNLFRDSKWDGWSPNIANRFLFSDIKLKIK